MQYLWRAQTNFNCNGQRTSPRQHTFPGRSRSTPIAVIHHNSSENQLHNVTTSISHNSHETNLNSWLSSDYNFHHWKLEAFATGPLAARAFHDALNQCDSSSRQLNHSSYCQAINAAAAPLILLPFGDFLAFIWPKHPIVLARERRWRCNLIYASAY